MAGRACRIPELPEASTFNGAGDLRLRVFVRNTERLQAVFDRVQALAGGTRSTTTAV